MATVIAVVKGDGNNAVFATADTAAQTAFNTAMANIVAASTTTPFIAASNSNIMEESGGTFNVQYYALVKYTT